MTRAKSYVSHEVPDYPVQNLQAALHGRGKHAKCDSGCEAKRYFDDLVPRLEGRHTWNIWATNG
ncbi:hypothetical protein AB0N05_33340 [Nocardia sp. NPDC051030]|uniref:hypothetical protein n=1 Tax=Nocardia sp. NPDC051030 TaxID=3155162 RepID=UPI003420850E